MNVFDLRIETARLLLRPPRIEDFDGYAELVGDEETARHIGGHVGRAAAWRKFLQQPGAWAVQGFGMFSVLDKASGQWLGQCGPWRPEGWPGNEVGWSFLRSAWGHGYATEAATAAMDWAFSALDWQDVIHCIAPENVASQRVAQRLGSMLLRQSSLPAPYETHIVGVWGQTRVAWEQGRGTVGGIS
ncbi:GNAT family N-acetyltransferase [Xanthomonadaceae bacterium JHOS43]|nr:GNAT family N-acetyltransferase [Xanthomonadaceae bacterium JHOS43]MCX7564158.1 GNAT family N-acetyltransferase [Xanthomonadaceae bacterium XH05]